MHRPNYTDAIRKLLMLDGAKIREAKARFVKGDVEGSAALIREVREDLQAFERRLSSASASTPRLDSARRPSRKLQPGDKVVIEIEGHGKSEFVDATVISATARAVNVKTYWGRVIENHPARLVRRR